MLCISKHKTVSDLRSFVPTTIFVRIFFFFLRKKTFFSFHLVELLLMLLLLLNSSTSTVAVVSVRTYTIYLHMCTCFWFVVFVLFGEIKLLKCDISFAILKLIYVQRTFIYITFHLFVQNSLFSF